MDQLCNIEEPEGWPRFVPYDDQMDTDDAFSDSNQGPQSPVTALRSDSSGSDAIRPAGIPKRWAQKAPPGIQYELYGEWLQPFEGLNIIFLLPDLHLGAFTNKLQ